MECDAAGFLGVGTIDFGADPYHVSGCEQFVQHTRLVVANACGEDRGFPNGGVEVYAFKLFDHTHQPVDAFMGAQGEHEVREFVQRLLPTDAEAQLAALIEAGDESSLRSVLEVDPGNEDAIVALAELLVDRGDVDEARALLERIPESDRTRHVAAKARVHLAPDDDYDDRLTTLLDRVKTDDEARQEFVDILELMGPHDPRTAKYRKLLTSRLF